MFYILNFQTHGFIPCNSADETITCILGLLKNGAHQSDLEVINGLVEEVRFDVNQFHTFCKNLALAEQSNLDALEPALEGEILIDSPEIEALKGEISNLRHELDGVMGYQDENELAPHISKLLFRRECELYAAQHGIQLDEKQLKEIETVYEYAEDKESLYVDEMVKVECNALSERIQLAEIRAEEAPSISKIMTKAPNREF